MSKLEPELVTGSTFLNSALETCPNHPLCLLGEAWPVADNIADRGGVGRSLVWGWADRPMA